MVGKLREVGESSITIKAAAVIGIVCTLLGVLFNQVYGHESRLSKLEQCVIGIQTDAQLTQKIVLAIREDQVTFYRSIDKNWKSSFDLKSEIYKGDK